LFFSLTCPNSATALAPNPITNYQPAMTQSANANGNLLAAISAIACCNIAVGVMVQVIPLTMEAKGLSAGLIGANTSVGQLGVFLSGLALPLLTRRFSSKHIVLFGIASLCAAFIAFLATEPLWAWYAIRFAAGLAIAALFTLSETWITMAAGTARRARIMGIYTSVLTVTFGAAPFLISAIGFSGPLPWLIAAACMVPGFLVVFAVKVDAPNAEDKGKSFASVLKKGWAIYACIFATTTFEGICLSFFTIFGMRNGIDYATSAQILGTGIVGCLLLFYPIGQLADRWSRGRTATLCAVVAIVFSALTAYTIDHWSIWPIMILQRAGAFGVYIVALTTIGDRFSGTELVSASALVAICWGLGGMAGPPLAGALIDQFSINLVPWMMAACYGVALVALALNRWTLEPKHSS
jgi:MFS family permease